MLSILGDMALHARHQLAKNLITTMPGVVKPAALPLVASQQRRRLVAHGWGSACHGPGWNLRSHGFL